MSWKCEQCGQKLSGKEKFCPECAAKAVYMCKNCGKVMDNGKHKYCPICNTERAENRNDAIKKAGGAIGGVAATAGSIVLAIATRGKHGGGKA